MIYRLFFHIQFLENDFIDNYINRWENQASNNEGIPKDEQNRLCLSKQTLHGWRMTGKNYFLVSLEGNFCLQIIEFM